MAKAAVKPISMEPRRRGGRPKIDTPSPVDVYVGSRVRQRRTLLGMSQEKLGTALGLTFQQVQKYERGANRIGCSRLWDLARILDVQISYFFEDMPPLTGSARHTAVASAALNAIEADPMAKRETLELVRSYYRIADPQVRRSLYMHIKALGAP